MTGLFDKIRTYSTLGLVLLLVAVGGYAMLTGRELDDTRRERDEAVRQRQAAERAIIVLADNHAQQQQRDEIRTTAREDIRAMPKADRERPLGEIWRRSFRAADEMAGVK